MPFDSRPPQAGEHARLDELLSAWERWQHEGGTQHLRTATSRFWGSGSVDFDTLVDQCDERDVQALDAAVWDLQPLMRTAIMHRHLGAVWRPNRPDADIERVYLQARLALSAALVRRRVP